MKGNNKCTITVICLFSHWVLHLTDPTTKNDINRAPTFKQDTSATHNITHARWLINFKIPYTSATREKITYGCNILKYFYRSMFVSSFILLPFRETRGRFYSNFFHKTRRRSRFAAYLPEMFPALSAEVTTCLLQSWPWFAMWAWMHAWIGQSGLHAQHGD